MANLNVGELRPKIDLEKFYVDFSVIRTSLSVASIIRDLNISLSDLTDAGECRGKCPKCSKDKSFSLNINTNRFNCFAKGCILKGAGVIDFFAKLNEVPAKEASHLLACAYGIQPYSQVQVSESKPVENTASENTLAEVQTEQPKQSGEFVSREEFDELKQRFERLSIIVWSLLFEKGEIEENDPLFEDETGFEREAIFSR